MKHKRPFAVINIRLGPSFQLLELCYSKTKRAIMFLMYAGHLRASQSVDLRSRNKGPRCVSLSRYYRAGL